MIDPRKDRAVGAFIGLAIGDAVGTAVEFQPRDSFPPVKDMAGGGPFRLRPGEWTDDTAMALCLADSLLARGGALDPHTLLTTFCNWWKLGWNSVTGECFDIGNATRAALDAFARDGSLENNAAPHLQANGSIMRLAPVVLCALDREDAVRLALVQGRTTHAAPVPQQCCEELAGLLWDLVETGDHRLVGRGYSNRSRRSMVSTGHAPATLDAARWAVATTRDFRSAVLRSVNLGEDADTVGAVTGQIAGALYGVSGMPESWLATLAWREEIERRAAELWSLRSEA